MPRVLALRALLTLTAIVLLVAAPARAADPPPNDDFASAEALAPAGATATADTTAATFETGEPRPAYSWSSHSVWYSWTPAADVVATIDTAGSGFDTALGAYTGGALNALTLVASNNDAGTSTRTSRFTFLARAGVTYRVVATGYSSSAYGDLRLELTTRPLPPNDLFAAAIPLGSAATASTSGYNLGATAETGEPQHFPYDPSARSVWYSWTAPKTGSLTIRATSTSYPTIAAYTGDTLTGLKRVPNQAQEWNGGAEQIRIRVEAGTTYRIAIDSRYGGGDFALALELLDAPPNDDFAAPLPLVGLAADVVGSTVNATQEPCEPVHDDNYYDPSVWYTWTAPESGGVTIDTAGSSFSTVLGIYTGDALCQLTRVPANRLVDSPAKRSFRATAGVTYRIAVDGRSGRMGAYKLSLRHSPPPLNDLLVDAQALTGATVDVSGSLLGATTETGEKAPGGAVGATVWYSWTADTNGPTTVTLPSGPYDTGVAVYTGTAVGALTSVSTGRGGSYYGASFRARAGTTYLIAVDGGSAPLQSDFKLALRHNASPANDDFAAAVELTGTATAATGTTAHATTEEGEPRSYYEYNSIWYSWTAPADGGVTLDTGGSGFDAVVGVYSGDALRSLTWVGGNDGWYSSSRPKRVAFRATAGVTYRIRVAGYYSSGALSLALKLHPPPVNDMWATAVPLASAAAVSAAGSTLGASAETGEPAHFSYDRAKTSVWYSWTAPSDGALTIKATGDFQPVLAAYTGSGVGALARVRNQAQDWNGGPEQIRVRVEAGTTYYVAIDARYAPGDFSLSLQLVPHPPNDDFEDATELAGLAADVVGSTVGATQEDCEPVHDQNYYDPSVWYTWTAPESGAVTLDTAGSSFPTVLGVYTGDILCKLERVAVRRMSDASQMAKRGFRAVAGKTYRIAVDGQQAKMGDFKLSLRHSPPPANDMLAAAEPLEGAADVATGSNFGATSEPGEPGAPEQASVWYSWTAPASGLARVELPTDDFDAQVEIYRGDSIASLERASGGDYRYYDSAVDFRAVAGTTYRIVVRGREWGARQGDFTIKLSSAPAPPNDDFADRVELTGSSGRADGTIRNATREDGEPSHDYWYSSYASVWYSWTAPETGLAVFKLPTSDGASYVAAYEGDVLASLTRVGERGWSGARFRAVEGRTYRIVVGGSNTFDRGAFALTWEIVPPPSNDDFADAIELTGESTNRTGTTAGATTEPGEPQQQSYDSGATVWYAWTAPVSGQVTLKTTSGAVAAYRGESLDQLELLASTSSWSYYYGAYFRAVAGTTYRIRVTNGLTYAPAPFTVSVKVTPPPPNDDFENATALDDTVSGTTFGATAQPGEPVRAGGRGTVWYAWTPKTSGTGLLTLSNSYYHGLTVFSGDSLGTLRRHAAGGDYYGSTKVRLRVTAGTTYRIAVDREYSDYSNSFTLGAEVLPGPPNDDFEDATVLSGASDRRSGSNVNATFQIGEPSAWGSGSTVWYRWTAPRSGRATVDLSGSSFNTVLNAYTGSSLNTLQRIGYDYDGGEGTTSKLTISARAGTTYSFQVDADYGSPGSIELALSQEAGPPNDDFAAAAEIAGAEVTVTGTNRLATHEPDEVFNTYSGGASVWYRWTAPATGRATIDLSGSGFDTTLGVYEGTAVGALSRLATADGGGTDRTSKLGFTARAGRTYRISVDGNYGSTGDIKLRLSQATAPPNDDFAAAAQLEGETAVATGTTAGATADEREPSYDAHPYASVWYRWTAPASGVVTVETSNAAFQARLGAYTGTDSEVSYVASGSGRISFRVSAGTTYSLVVDGQYGGAVGGFDLRLALKPPPANDLFVNAVALAGLSVDVTGDTTGANQEPCEPTHDDNYYDPSVWFKWTAAVGGRVEIDTTGSSFNTVLGIYVGADVCALVRVPVERLSGAGVPSRRAFHAQAGTTYRIAVDGAWGATGGFQLHLRQTPDAPAPPDAIQPPPDEETPTPPEQTQTPSEETQAPPERTYVPPEQAYAPPEQAYAPPEQSYAPPERTPAQDAPAQDPPAPQPPAPQPLAEDPPAQDSPARQSPAQDPPKHEADADAEPFAIDASFPKQRLAAVLKRGLGGTVTCSADCVLTVVVTIDPTVARKHGLRGSKALVARVGGGGAAGEPWQAVVRFPKAVQARLKRARSVPLTIEASASSGGRVVTRTLRMTLKR